MFTTEYCAEVKLA